MSKIEIYRPVLIVVQQSVIKSGGTLSIRHIASPSFFGVDEREGRMLLPFMPNTAQSFVDFSIRP